MTLLVGALGYCQTFLLIFQATKIRCAKNYFDENFSNENFQIYSISLQMCEGNLIMHLHFMAVFLAKMQKKRENE